VECTKRNQICHKNIKVFLSVGTPESRLNVFGRGQSGEDGSPAARVLKLKTDLSAKALAKAKKLKFLLEF
jgi:hypothetical protein